MLITKTPLRVSLFGGGADYPEFYARHGAQVISMAIDKYVYVTAHERYDRNIRAGYTRTETVEQLDDLQHDLIREAIRSSGWDHYQRGIEVTTIADIPTAGVGLGSSAAVTIGVLNACAAMSGLTWSAGGLAEIAYDIEAMVLGRPCGIQDQYAVSHGGLRSYHFSKQGVDASMLNTLEPWVIPTLLPAMLLFFTNKVRDSSDILFDHVDRLEANTGALLEMQKLADAAYVVLHDAKHLFQIGPLLHESWRIKSGLVDGVAYQEVNDVYDAALQAGATGGKVCGAGGGGYLLLFVPTESARHDVRALMREIGWPELPFTIEPLGSRIVFDDRRPK